VTRKAAEQLNCTGMTDYRALCDKTKPDFVFALGRHADMADEAKYLIANKIPFAIEKPCGMDLREVEEIAALAKSAGAFASVPLVIRNGDFYKLLQEHAADGYQYMHWRFIAGFASRYQLSGCDWMLDPKTSGGGCTINLSPHFFDLSLKLMGGDLGVSNAVMANAAWGHPVEDYSGVTLASPAGAVSLTETGYIFPAPTSTFDLHFAMKTPKMYIIAHNAQMVELIDNSGKREYRQILTTNVPNYRTYVFDVLDRVKKGSKPLASLDDMVPVMKIIADAYAQGRPMKVL
jgi:predicted dehydrogenase